MHRRLSPLGGSLREDAERKCGVNAEMRELRETKQKNLANLRESASEMKSVG